MFEKLKIIFNRIEDSFVKKIVLNLNKGDYTMRREELWCAVCSAPVRKKEFDEEIKELYTQSNNEDIEISMELKEQLIVMGRMKFIDGRRAKKYHYQGFQVFLNGKATDIGLLEISRLHKKDEPLVQKNCIVNVSIMDELLRYDWCFGNDKIYANSNGKKVYIGRIVINIFNGRNVLHNCQHEVHHCSLRSNNMVECLRDTKGKNHLKEYGNWRHTQSVQIRNFNEFNRFFEIIERHTKYCRILEQYLNY